MRILLGPRRAMPEAPTRVPLPKRGLVPNPEPCVRRADRMSPARGAHGTGAGGLLLGYRGEHAEEVVVHRPGDDVEATLSLETVVQAMKC